jgi:uncharacterized protein with HEPN domain
MPNDDLVYLGHMLDMARKAVTRVEGKSRAEFDADEDLRIVLVHFNQVIGEAARRVSAETRALHPEIPWDGIVGMRHRLVHDYMDIDQDIVWEVATNRLQPLIEQLIVIVPPEDLTR